MKLTSSRSNVSILGSDDGKMGPKTDLKLQFHFSLNVVETNPTGSKFDITINCSLIQVIILWLDESLSKTM